MPEEINRRRFFGLAAVSGTSRLRKLGRILPKRSSKSVAIDRPDLLHPR
jgi:hypothetical protein